MNSPTALPLAAAPSPWWRAYWELLKPRVTLLVVLTTLATGYMAAIQSPSWAWYGDLALGTALLAGGTAALNQRWERESDARMRRTAGRPLPTRRVTPQAAEWFGLVLALLGLVILWREFNPLTALLGLMTSVLYLLAYTPLKKRSPLSTLVGAFPGAGPVLMGWAAAAGRLDGVAWALFTLQFLWQFPHFLAIAWLYREDYERAGICMLPVVDLEARETGLQMLLYSLALIPVSLLPTILGLDGRVYFWLALALGCGLLVMAARAAWRRSLAASRALLRASVIYLPLIFLAMIVDKWR